MLGISRYIQETSRKIIGISRYKLGIPRDIIGISRTDLEYHDKYWEYVYAVQTWNI